MTTAIKSVSISLELANKVEKYRISLSEACRIGISVMLSELGEPQYLNRTNIGRKVQSLVEQLQNVLEKKE